VEGAAPTEVKRLAPLVGCLFCGPSLFAELAMLGSHFGSAAGLRGGAVSAHDAIEHIGRFPDEADIGVAIVP